MSQPQSATPAQNCKYQSRTWQVPTARHSLHGNVGTKYHVVLRKIKHRSSVNLQNTAVQNYKYEIQQNTVHSQIYSEVKHEKAVHCNVQSSGCLAWCDQCVVCSCQVCGPPPSFTSCRLHLSFCLVATVFHALLLKKPPKHFTFYNQWQLSKAAACLAN